MNAKERIERLERAIARRFDRAEIELEAKREEFERLYMLHLLKDPQRRPVVMRLRLAEAQAQCGQDEFENLILEDAEFNQVYDEFERELAVIETGGELPAWAREQEAGE